MPSSWSRTSSAYIEQGLTPRDAAHQAMREVSGPIIAIALVLCAVFVPMAFLSGVTGQFYKQFAVTIAISTVISAINSLTLSPALAAKLLRGRTTAPKDRLCAHHRACGSAGCSARSTASSTAARDGYKGVVRRSLRPARRGVRRLCSACWPAPCVLFQAVPGGFIPTQDKLYLFAGSKLPEGASLARTDAVTRKMGEIAPRRRWCRFRSGLCGLQCLAVREHAKHHDVLHHPQAVRRASAAAPREINEEINAKFAAHQGRVLLRVAAAAHPGARQWFGLFALPEGPRRPGLWRAAECAESVPGRDRAERRA